jgi:cell division inhibitor SepF
MSVFKRAMSYLGLGPEDAYDDYDLPEEPERPGRGRSPYAPEPEPPVRTMPARPPTGREPAANARFPQPSDVDSNNNIVVRPARQGSAVRTVPGAQSRPHTVRPRRFDQAQEVADRFKDGQPVIVNLQDVERELERRLIDFCSGLCYALDGKMEKVANGVYLLTPANATISAEDRRLLGSDLDD